MTSEPTIENSSELLRLALPLMSKYRVPTVPNNFTVWYDYVAKTNPSLCEAIDRRIEKNEPVDGDFTSQLYRQFYGDSVESHAEAVQSKVDHIISSLFDTIKDADNEVSKYEHDLEDCAKQLDGDMPVEKLKSVVAGLIESTHKMHEGNHSLHEHLEESRQEAAALREELEKVKAESKTDPLTALLNRKGFDEGLAELEADDEFGRQSHSLLIADIDKFKSINDNYGHLFGDKVIKIVATALTKLTKGKDLAARFGGEEFVVFLPDTELEGARVVAENIRQSLEKGRVYNPKTGEEIKRVTISIGVTPVVHGEEVAAAIARADEALYRAKESGRNRVELAPLEPEALAAAS